MEACEALWRLLQHSRPVDVPPPTALRARRRQSQLGWGRCVQQGHLQVPRLRPHEHLRLQVELLTDLEQMVEVRIPNERTLRNIPSHRRRVLPGPPPTAFDGWILVRRFRRRLTQLGDRRCCRGFWGSRAFTTRTQPSPDQLQLTLLSLALFPVDGLLLLRLLALRASARPGLDLDDWDKFRFRRASRLCFRLLRGVPGRLVLQDRPASRSHESLSRELLCESK